MKSEREIIKELKKIFPKGKADVGIGDDAAVYKDLIFTTDLLVENTHFKRSHPPYFLGRKSVNVNISDIAAMGGEPLFVLMSLSIPGKLTGEWLDEFLKGVKSSCEENSCTLIGGDLSRAEHIFISVTAVGKTKNPVLRGTSKEGELIVLVGELGASRAGRETIEEGIDKFEKLRMAFLNPIPRVKEARTISKQATSMIDISDGLIIDLRRILGGKGAKLYENSLIPSEELEEFCKLKGKDPLEYILYGGEDYALLFTTGEKPQIGKIIGKVEGNGIFLGERRVEEKGFDHFT